MPSKNFPKEELQLVIWGDAESLDLIEDEIVDQGRWSIHHAMVFRDNETQKLYKINYSTGATEQQYEQPFEYEPNEINCVEVVEKEKVVITYVPA